MTLFWMFLGFLLLVLGGEFIVRASIAISLKFNISKVVIGMTVVAFATSLPELLVSLKAAVNGSSSIAINNVIGSNIFNIGSVLGLTTIIKPILITDSNILDRDIVWMLVFVFLVLILSLFPKKNNITKTKGFLLVVLYSGFILSTYLK